MTIKPIKLKLHIKISMLFAVIMLLVSSILIFLSYQHLVKVINRVNEITFNRIINDTTECLESDFLKISSEMKIISHTSILQGNTVQDNFAQLSVFKIILDNNDGIDAVYVGYSNGDLFLLRKILDIDLYKKYSLPEKTKYMLTTVEFDGLKRTTKHYYYNDNFDLTGEMADKNFIYNSTQREWYKKAVVSSDIIVTAPYIFYTSKKPGITFALKNAETDNVIGADYTMDSLSALVKKYSLSADTRTLMYNAAGQILTANKDEKLVQHNGDVYSLATIHNIKDPVINDFSKSSNNMDNVAYISNNVVWLGKKKSFELLGNGTKFTVLTVTPEKTLMVKANKYKRDLILTGIAVIVLILPIVWLVSVLIAKPLTILSKKLDRIKNFDFKSSIGVSSSVVEIDNLINSSQNMIETIEKFQRIASTITKQQSYDKLLLIILKETISISNGAGGAIYLFDQEDKYLEIASLFVGGMDTQEQNKILEEIKNNGQIEKDVFEQYISQKSNICFELFGHKCIENNLLYWPEIIGINKLSLSVIPLKDSQNEMMGYIVFAHEYSNNSIENDKSKLAFITALSGFVAAAIEGQLLLNKRKELLQSIIVLIADAIDAKSPYTGKHCQRVPVITKMLIEEACNSNDGLYKDYNLNEDEWEEVRVASWLHDCGKVITQVDVVDKATKLECIYNRIHEIRMRFELLKSYADTDYWKKLYAGGDKNKLEAERERLKAELDSEFRFIAECNIGGEFMSDESEERLKEIGNRVWVRTIDNTLGLSDVELNLIKSNGNNISLPVEEKLLSDKHEHIIQKQQKDYNNCNDWGFTMEEPECFFNRGELYNLGIRRGTLTEEDRYIINAHMVHTIKMLSALPFPKNMKNIVEIAGSHHEKMEGGGYPRAVKAKDLPLAARAMAIADIFEALTAADRPYKKIKTLSESLKIMKHMASDNHIDKELFRLFIISKVAERYANKYLLKEQLDEVNIEELLG